MGKHNGVSPSEPPTNHGEPNCLESIFTSLFLWEKPFLSPPLHFLLLCGREGLARPLQHIRSPVGTTISKAALVPSPLGKFTTERERGQVTEFPNCSGNCKGKCPPAPAWEVPPLSPGLAASSQAGGWGKLSLSLHLSP